MDIISLFYTFSGFLFGAAFIPQIATLIKDRSGAVSFSISSCAIFTLCSLAGLLYAITHSTDSYFIFCSFVGVGGNLSVLTLSAFRRLHPAKALSRR